MIKSKYCILSGLEIPRGKQSTDHYLARSLCPDWLACVPDNKFPAIKVFNNIKSNLYPCVWYERRYDLCYDALEWNLRRDDKNLIRRVLWDGFPEYDPCSICLARIYKEYCLQNITR